MKKFLVMLLSVLMAFVMCFSFVACGNDSGNNNDNTDDNTNDPSKDPDDGDDAPDIDVAQKLSAAFDNLYTVNGYTGEITLQTSVKTNAEAAENIVVSFDKRGDKVKLVVPVFTASSEEEITATTQEMILDLKTGYLYENSTDGYYFTQPIPANTLDYALAVISENIAETPNAQFGGSYDNATKTASDSIDIGGDINGLLQPIYDTYENGTLLNLIDKYIDSSGSELSSLNDLIEAFTFIVTTAKDQTVGFALDFIESAYGVDLIEQLQSNGVELDEADLEVIENRTVGEMAAGVCFFVEEVIEDLMPSAPSAIDEGDGEYVEIEGGLDIGSIMQIIGMVKEVANEYMGTLAYYALLAPIDIEGFVTVNGNNQKVVDETMLSDMLDDTTELLTGILGSLKVKALVDMIPSSELAFMMSNGITIAECKFDYSVTFDDDYNIKTLTVSASLSHSYDETADEQTPEVFANNGYEFKLTADLGNYTDSTTDFDITLAEDQGVAETSLAIVYDLTKDVTVYVETSEATLPDGNITALLVNVADSSDMTPLDIAAGDVTVDGAKKTVTVKGSFIADALENADNDSIITIVVSYGEGDSYSVVLAPLSTDPEALGAFIENVLEGMSNIGGEGNMQGVPQA